MRNKFENEVGIKPKIGVRAKVSILESDTHKKLVKGSILGLKYCPIECESVIFREGHCVLF